MLFVIACLLLLRLISPYAFSYNDYFHSPPSSPVPNFIPSIILQSLLSIFGCCSARTGQNRVTWKTPSSAAFVSLPEPVALLAILCSPHANASMKQYQCGRTQPLFCAGQNHGTTDVSKPRGLRQIINNNYDIQNTIINNYDIQKHNS